MRAARHHLLLMLEVIIEHVAQVEHLRFAVDKAKHYHAEGILHLRVLVKLIEYDVRVDVAFELDDNPHAVAVGLVAQGRNALDALFVIQLGYLLNEPRLVHLIGYLGHDYAAPAVAHLLDLGLCAHDYAAAARAVCLTDAGVAHDCGACREIGAGNIAHQLFDGYVAVVDHRNVCVDHLAEVMRRYVGRHADGNAARTVDEKVREAAGQNVWLHERFVEVGAEVDCVFSDVAHHLVGKLRKARLGITHRGRAVAVDGAEVALTLDELIAYVEILRKADHRVVNR